jgi:hypothetical protein
MDADLFARAAKHMSFSSLTWLHSVGCPYDDRVLEEYVKKLQDGNPIRWFLDNQFPCNQATIDYLLKTPGRVTKQIYKLLVKFGYIN